MRTEAVVSWKVVDGEGCFEEKRICLLRNSISVDIYYAFIDYRPLTDDDDVVEGGMMQTARLDTGVATLLTCFEQRENRGEHRQKVYPATFTSLACKKVNNVKE